MKRPLYQQIIDSFRADINDGLRQPGDRMPSVRELCTARNISKSTVLSAYMRLESEGLIESKPRSGYYVTKKIKHLTQKVAQGDSNPESTPLLVSTNQVVIDIMEKGAAFDLLPDHQPSDTNITLRRCLTKAYRQQSGYEQKYYNSPQGSVALRQQISNHLHSSGSHLDVDDLMITSGCQNALLLALMATTKPGDIVAIESPCFYGAIQLLETLGLQIMELPSSPVSGINVDAMADIFERWPISALMISPCYATPTGSSITEADKQRILALCLHHQTPIIEDDIYGELYFGLERPRTLHSYDKTGSVLLCSSFSKCLSHDLRIGWIAPGRYLEKIKRLKIATSLATSSTLQNGIADFMEQGFFERHLRQKRIILSRQNQQLQELILTLIPTAKSWTQPNGGLSLWVELPAHVDTIKLYRAMQSQGITLTPGALFTAQQSYNNFLRMSFAHEWTSARIAAIKRIGEYLNNERNVGN